MKNEAIELSEKSIMSEIEKLKFQYDRAIENKLDAKKLGQIDRLKCCERSEVINDSAKAALEWALMIIRWHKEEIELENRLLEV